MSYTGDCIGCFPSCSICNATDCSKCKSGYVLDEKLECVLYATYVSSFTTKTTPESTSGLSKRAVAGIVMGSIIGAIGIVAVVVYYIRKRMAKDAQPLASNDGSEARPVDANGSTINNESSVSAPPQEYQENYVTANVDARNPTPVTDVHSQGINHQTQRSFGGKSPNLKNSTTLASGQNKHSQELSRLGSYGEPARIQASPLIHKPPGQAQLNHSPQSIRSVKGPKIVTRVPHGLANGQPSLRDY
jgi:hypothetical protein